MDVTLVYLLKQDKGKVIQKISSKKSNFGNYY